MTGLRDSGNPPVTEQASRPSTLAVCRYDGCPLIGTFHWRGREWYCIHCGSLYEFFGPKSKPTTDALWEQYEALQAEWDEHAGAKLLTPSARHDGCEKCSAGEDHVSHATDEERAAHEAAEEWLLERAKAGRYV